MRTLKKRAMAVVLSVIMVLSCFAGMTFSVGAETSGDYEYEIIDDNYVQIIRYTGNDKDIKIPSEIDGRKVIKIGSGNNTSIFESQYKDRIVSVTIPDGVEYIGGHAFWGCKSLTKITIPDSVVNIGDWAFKGCSGLTSITIPQSVTEIGMCVFEGCTGLSSIIISEGVTKIGYEAFKGCTGLSSIIISEGVTEIDWGAFEGCTGLTSVIIPAGVKEIGAYAFYDCINLTNVTIFSDLGYLNIWPKSFGYYKDKLSEQDVQKSDFTINGHSGAGANAYADNNGFKFVCIKRCEHANIELRNEKSATCTEDGYSGYKYCLDCEQIVESGTEIKALGHKSEVIKGKAATCTEKGLTDGEKCSVCGTVLKAQTEIKALGHKSEVIKGKAATCTETGLTDGEKCSVCGTVLKAQMEIKALGHKSEVIKGKAATCTETGLTDGEKCSVCGTVLKAQTEIKALGHKFENGVCAVCGALDPDYKLTLKSDGKLTMNEEKSLIFGIPENTNGMTVSDFKSQFDNKINISIDDSAFITNGMKFTFGNTEYTVILKGDVNADGKISAADARTILRIAAKLDSPDEITREAADINSDGKVTSSEARSVLRFAAKLQNKIS